MLEVLKKCGVEEDKANEIVKAKKTIYNIYLFFIL